MLSTNLTLTTPQAEAVLSRGPDNIVVNLGE